MHTMTKSKTNIILAVMVVFSLTGCTSRAWYEGFREAARQRCYQLNNEDDIQRCLEDIESGTYEEYQQSRQQ